MKNAVKNILCLVFVVTPFAVFAAPVIYAPSSITCNTINKDKLTCTIPKGWIMHAFVKDENTPKKKAVDFKLSGVIANGVTVNGQPNTSQDYVVAEYEYPGYPKTYVVLHSIIPWYAYADTKDHKKYDQRSCWQYYKSYRLGCDAKNVGVHRCPLVPAMN